MVPVPVPNSSHATQRIFLVFHGLNLKLGGHQPVQETQGFKGEPVGGNQKPVPKTDGYVLGPAVAPVRALDDFICDLTWKPQADPKNGSRESRLGLLVTTTEP